MNRAERKLAAPSASSVVVIGSNPTKKNPRNVLIDYRLEQNQLLGAKFIFECGIKLEAEPMTIASAAILYFKFFKQVNEKDYDIYLIGSKSLYLAGKVESQCIKIRDIINTAYSTIHRGSGPLELGDKYWSFRDAIVQAELLMMRILSFQVVIQHSHKFLIHYLKTLEEWVGYDGWSKNPVARSSWALLQDFHQDPSILNYPPQAIAVAAIQLAMLCYGAQIPLCTSEGRNSWHSIIYPDVRPEIQEEIMAKMFNVYETETELLRTRMFRGETANGDS